MMVHLIVEDQNVVGFVATCGVQCVNCKREIPQGKPYTRMFGRPWCKRCRGFEDTIEPYIDQILRETRIIERQNRIRRQKK